jgi:type III secretion protein J
MNAAMRPWGRPWGLSRLVFALSLALFAIGCTREVAAGLDEMDANRGVVALARSGVDAEKIPDPSAEGRFRLVVQRDDATTAIAVLAGEELPRPHPPAPPEASLVSSPEAERAARIAATAAQVERTLASIDGVLDARVLLDVPAIDPLSAALAPQGEQKGPRATASVLLRHRGATPPVPPDDLRRLVAGAVSGLAAADVAIVLVSVPSPSVSAERQLAYLGPLAISRGSLSTFRAVAGAALALVAALGTTILVLSLRLRKSKEALEAASQSEGGALEKRPAGASR